MNKVLIVIVIFRIGVWDNWFKGFLLVCVKICEVKIRLVWIGLSRWINCVIFC